MKGLLHSRIIRDTLMLTVMQLVLDSAALMLNSFITHRLGTSAIGILSLMGTFLSLAGILSNGNAFLCTSRLISEELGRENGNPERVLFHGIQLCLMMSTAVSAVLFAFAEPLSQRFFSGAQMAQAVRIMPAALVTGAVSACLKGYLNACRRAGAAAVGDVIEFAVKSAVIVILTLSAGEADENGVCRILILSIVAGNFASLLYLVSVFAGTHRRSSGSGTLSFRRYAALSFPIMGGGVLTSVLSSMNDALIPVCLRQYGDSADRALSLFGVFEAIVIPTLFFPSVVLCSLSGMIVSESARAAAAEDSTRIRSLTSRLLRMTFIYAVIASAVLMRTGAAIGELLGGGELAGRMITVIAPVVPFIYLEIVLEALIKGMGMQGFSSLNYLAEYVIRIAVVLIFVPRAGFAGIAASYYASNVFGNTMRLVKVLKSTGVPLAPARNILLPVCTAAVTMPAAGYICRIAGADTVKLPGLVLFSALWVLMYSGILLLVINMNTGSINKEIMLCNMNKESRQL